MANNLSVSDEVSNSILLNEHTNPNQLSNAGNGQSGYSVGRTQFDFHANSNTALGRDAVSGLGDLLKNTAAQTGITNQQIDTITSNITVLGSSKAITPKMVAAVNQALTTPQGGSLYGKLGFTRL